MTTTTTQTEPPKNFGSFKPAKPPTALALQRRDERLARMAARYLRLSDQGKAKFDKRRLLLARMIKAGLAIGQPIEIGAEKFILVDNFEGDRTGGWATVNRFDLKPLSKKAAAELARDQRDRVSQKEAGEIAA